MDRILAEKLEGIKARMERAGTPAEAEAAAAAYQRIIMKHGLTEAEAMAAGETLKPDYVVALIKVAEPKSPGVGWRNTLFHVLTEYNFVRSFNPGKGGWHIVVVVGTRAHIEAVVSLFQMTSFAFEQMSFADYDRRLDEWDANGRFWLDPKPGKQKHHLSFMLGAANGLRAKMRKEREQEAETMEGASALVIVKDKELDQAVTDLIGKVGSPSEGYSASDRGAYGAGWKAGKSYSRNTPIGGGSRATPA